jgi:hypothetical protein
MTGLPGAVGGCVSSPVFAALRAVCAAVYLRATVVDGDCAVAPFTRTKGRVASDVSCNRAAIRTNPPTAVARVTTLPDRKVVRRRFRNADFQGMGGHLPIQRPFLHAHHQRQKAQVMCVTVRGDTGAMMFFTKDFGAGCRVVDAGL